MLYNLSTSLSVVYLTICILHCDKDFYKYTRKLDASNNFFLKMLSAFLVFCIHSNALQTRFFHGDFFTEDNVTEEQPYLGPYCLQYKLHNKMNSKLRDLFHVYLNKCDFHFSRLHVNKINNFCFLLNNACVIGMTKSTNGQFKA